MEHKRINDGLKYSHLIFTKGGEGFLETFKKIDKAFGKFLTFLNALTAVMVFILMILITTDVIARTAFDHPFQGVSEIVSNCIIILCFFEIPYILMRGSHVRTTLVYDRVGPKGKNLIDFAACLIGALVFTLVLISSWPGFVHAVKIGDSEIAGSVRITTIPGRLSIIIGSVLMIIESVFLAIKNVIKLVKPDAFDDEKEQKLTDSDAEGGMVQI